VKLLIVMILFFVNISAQDFMQKKANSQAREKFKTISEYKKLETSIDQAIVKLDALGYLWTTKGVLYLYDYKFDDGYIKADYSKAEACFESAVKRADTTAHYFLAYALASQGKIEKALTVLEKRIIYLNSFDSKTGDMLKDYTSLVNFYGGIVIEYRKTKHNAQKAITYLFDLAYTQKNSSSQLEVGVLYSFLKKNKQSEYFIINACTNTVQNDFVRDYCEKNVDIKTEKCESCEMKKKLEIF